MENKKVVTIQDISCYGQCSITVALPILSSLGYETAIVPSAILSTHTAGFKDFTVFDLSDEIYNILNHWKKEGIKFSCLYSGYLGAKKHIDITLDMKNSLLEKDGIFVLDPVMGDHGKLYPAFDANYVNEMKRLVAVCDVVIPNITEAALLTGIEYKTNYDESYIVSLVNGLKTLGAKKVVLTGVSYETNSIGVVVSDENGFQIYEHEKIPQNYHGTGDIYSSSLIGSYLNTNNLYEAAIFAADFVVSCIEKTMGDDTHNYGVKFEQVLKELLYK